ncbi:MAG: hypothetical protein QOE70_4746 [Chthoniobacter sp.]|jgi:hypothetical protein|nr:hypothetical protein [Chthoniobacter sp.]
MDPESTVPLIVDSITSSEEFDMARLIFFYIDAEESLDQWWLGLDGESIPFLMLGLAGIIVVPDGGDEFTNPQQIRDFFDRIETLPNREMRVETGDVWVPRSLLTARYETAARGDVFRVSFRLFGDSYSFRAGRIDREKFEHVMRDRAIEATFSEVETKAFREWSASEIGRSRERMNPELKLRDK